MEVRVSLEARTFCTFGRSGASADLNL